MDKNRFTFKVFEKEYYDKIFEDFKKIPSNWNTKRINQKVLDGMSQVLIVGQPFTQEIIEKVSFYRIRVYKEGDPIVNERDPNSFSYPPSKFCKPGRGNRKGEQVLYTSSDQHTPFHEMASQIKIGSSIIYLSKWKIKKIPENKFYRNFFVGLFAEKGSYAEILSEGLNERLIEMHKSIPDYQRELYLYGQKKYAELFTTPGDQFYHITSSLIHDSFGRKRDLDIPAVAYPSVAKDKTAVNFVFRKDFVDEYMELVEVHKLTVKDLSPETVITNLIEKAEVKDGKVKWLSLIAHNINIGFDKALVELNSAPETFTQLKANEGLTNCCKEHKYSIKEFLSRHQITEDYIMKGAGKYPVECSLNKIPERVERALIIVTTGKVFVENNVAEDNFVTKVIVPVTYSLKYE